MVRNILICWYSNADTLTNKMAELRNRINQAQEKPLVTEVKSKKARYQWYEIYTTEQTDSITTGAIMRLNFTLRSRVRSRRTVVLDGELRV